MGRHVLNKVHLLTELDLKKKELTKLNFSLKMLSVIVSLGFLAEKNFLLKILTVYTQKQTFWNFFSYVAIKLVFELFSELPGQLLEGEHNIVSFWSQFFQRTTAEQDSKKVTFI